MSDDRQETARQDSPHYAMVTEWSVEGHAYIVSLPQWGDTTHTHGASYEEAVRNGQEVLEDVIELWREQGHPLPRPRVIAEFRAITTATLHSWTPVRPRRPFQPFRMRSQNKRSAKRTIYVSAPPTPTTS
jgi:predicted RNase H-like HicB family nuclease